MSGNRIFAELSLIIKQPIEGITVSYNVFNMNRWHCTIKNPVPSEISKYVVELIFPDDYPFMPPTARFLTPIYHPNVDVDGIVRLSILGDDWSPSLTGGKILLTIMSVLHDPELKIVFGDNDDNYYNNDSDSN